MQDHIIYLEIDFRGRRKLPDTTAKIVTDLWTVIQYIATALVGVVGWIVRRLIKRIDTIEENYIQKADMSDIKAELRDGFRSVSGEIRHTHERIDAMLMQDRKRHGE